MRTQITVTDLSLKQWDWIQTELRREYEMRPGVARVCVEFELVPEFNSVHVEMPALALTRALNLLERMALVEAALTPDSLPDRTEEENRATGLQVTDRGPSERCSCGLTAFAAPELHLGNCNARPEGADQ